MAEDHIISEGVQRSQQQAAQKQAAAARLSQYSIAQEAAREGFQEWGDLSAWNPLAMARNFQTIERRARERARPEDTHKQEKIEEEQEINAVERLQETAENYQRKNPELQARTLLALRVRLSPQDTVEDILRKLREAYPDLALADEALDFLIATAGPEMRKLLEKTKAELNRLHERDIKAGRNIGAQARNFSSQGLGSPTALRDLYRHIIGNPRDALTLFQELSGNYPFEKMKVVIDFVLHSLGADLKSKGPSISRQELERFMTETRNMQAILGIYKYFFSRMRLISSSFDRQGLVLPSRITFDMLARTFMRFLQEKYPSVDKALLLSQQLGIADDEIAQLIIYLQFRDAMRQVAPRLFRDEKHRQEILLCFMETLEDLEEELEEEEENDNKKKKK
ncbi:MAG: type III secretion system gatekeeper subunit SctW [Verrucomicrobia bacterium]|nr:type III secretion system gatekeeper subunit SctW [Verrucomicrobiota bacterium]